jgi:hypothetical protein
MTALRLPLFREITALLLLLALMLQSATAVAPGPAWWGSQSVADPDALPDDFAVANVGQLKYIATKAAAALEAEFPGGAGTAINALITSWNSPPASGVTRDDYLAINQGQLKAVAALFYDRLGQPYPWAGSSAAQDDYQLVNLGQLKHVFAFELKFRTPGTPSQIPAATLAAALAQWQALPVKPAGSSEDDFDGDGIPNLQEYLMGSPLFDPLDIDGDRILDSIEDAHPGVLSKLRFADAVEDYDGDGVMNYEEVLLGLNLASSTTSGRADGLGDAEVLAWSLAASTTLSPNTDAVQALWQVIDADWIDREVGSYYLYWLLETPVDGVPAGLASFREDVANWVWQPWNPGVWLIESPPLAHDPNWEPVDLDGNSVADFDRDNDNLPDLWEYRYTLDLRNAQDAMGDPDGDALTNLQEYQAGTNPRLADSDGDGFSDYMELWQGGDPVQQAIAPPLLLQVVGSSYPAIYSGQTTPALAVKVTQGGLPVAGVTVAFALTAGAGRLKPASSAVGTPGASLSQTTASDGIAAVTYESAAGEPEGTASISAGLAGASASQTFTVSIVAIPAAYGGAAGGDSTAGASGGLAGNPTKVPTPPRSTAMSAASIDAATADGYRIRVKRRSESQSYPKIDAFPEYLTPYGLNPAALVGWQDPFEIHTWADYTRLEFDALPFIAPLKKQVVPTGTRRYLVLVHQGEDVGSDSSGPPKYLGVLTFQYNEAGARVITLTGGIPAQFISTDGSSTVTIEPPLATKASERVWMRLVPVGFEKYQEAYGFDDTVEPQWQSIPLKSTAQGTNYLRRVKFIAFPGVEDKFNFEAQPSGNVTIQAEPPVNGTIILILQGLVIGETTLTAKIKDSGNVVQQIKLDVLKRTERNVDVRSIASLSGEFPDMPSISEIKEYVDSIWGVQANVWFNFNSIPSKILDYDKGPPDGALELGNSTPGTPVSYEGRVVMATINKIWKDSSSEIKLNYVIAINPPTIGGVTWFGEPPGPPPAEAYWVFVAQSLGVVSAETAIAHELGHCLGDSYIQHNSSSIYNLMIEKVNPLEPNPKEVRYQEWHNVKRP